MKFRELILKLNSIIKETNMEKTFDLISKIENGEAISDCTIRQSNVDPIELIRAYERRALAAEKQLKIFEDKLNINPVEFNFELEAVLNKIKNLYIGQKSLYENRIAILKAELNTLRVMLSTKRKATITKLSDYKKDK